MSRMVENPGKSMEVRLSWWEVQRVVSRVSIMFYHPALGSFQNEWEL